MCNALEVREKKIYPHDQMDILWYLYKNNWSSISKYSKNLNNHKNLNETVKIFLLI